MLRRNNRETDMARAKDPTEFRQAWQWHIDQLSSLALAANVQYHSFVEVKQILESWIHDALLTNLKDDPCE